MREPSLLTALAAEVQLGAKIFPSLEIILVPPRPPRSRAGVGGRAVDYIAMEILKM